MFPRHTDPLVMGEEELKAYTCTDSPENALKSLQAIKQCYLLAKARLTSAIVSAETLLRHVGSYPEFAALDANTKAIMLQPINDTFKICADSKMKLEKISFILPKIDAAEEILKGMIATLNTSKESKPSIYRDSPLISVQTKAIQELEALRKMQKYALFFKYYGTDNNKALRIACTETEGVILKKLANIYRLGLINLDPNQQAGEAKKNAFHIAAEKGGKDLYDLLATQFNFADQNLTDSEGKTPLQYLATATLTP